MSKKKIILIVGVLFVLGIIGSQLPKKMVLLPTRLLLTKAKSQKLQTPRQPIR